MELFIAGGCGEHGRNCFYVEQNGEAFLVDCGLLAGAEGRARRGVLQAAHRALFCHLSLIHI